MATFDESWIWHPDWTESQATTSAGRFVHFRKEVHIERPPQEPVLIHVTADTRYKLYVNSKLVSFGPVKGDESQWYYDEVDLQPHLRVGTNCIAIRVLRFYHATRFAPSFVRLPVGGLRVCNASKLSEVEIDTDSTWQCAIDPSGLLPVDIPYDDFLHIYENVDKRKDRQIQWKSAKTHTFLNAFGLGPPWRLAPRLIPYQRLQAVPLKAIHNIDSIVAREKWERLLLRPPQSEVMSFQLPAGTKHHLELEVDYHLTALIYFRFARSNCAGSHLRIVYSECYEDVPKAIPHHRSKGDRCDFSKQLFGPEDQYIFGGMELNASEVEQGYHSSSQVEEIFAPFHFRTFRFIAMDIEVAKDRDLVFNGIDLLQTHYPLNVVGEIDVRSKQPEAATTLKLWETSVRTLQNCMHDCYEDCPFYEQFQYAMDTRSSALFTYSLSGDDRLARQAIIQLHNSFRPEVGLTAARAPSHQHQLIPNFSLYWICMLADHFEYYSDVDFIRKFLGIADAVLETFNKRINRDIGLVSIPHDQCQWDFVDWTDHWKPIGVPPAGLRSGYQTFTSMLYIYTLKRQSDLLHRIGRTSLASEYTTRADAVTQSVLKHCYDGNFFTDGLARTADPDIDYGEQCQIWAVLSGVIEGKQARDILDASVGKKCSKPDFSESSIAMRFYTLRALSVAGGDIYDRHFHSFWDTWKEQLKKNVTTWVEDSIFERSDCHAWGCAPLYEFMAEVAGVRPAEPGWSVVSFKPRLKLFDDFAAKVPIGGKEGVVSIIACVQWKHGDNGRCKVSLSLENIGGGNGPLPVLVHLPGQEEHHVKLVPEGLSWEVDLL